MTSQEIEAIVGGYHGDAFRVLGPHSRNRKSHAQKTRWEVRAFLPQAESASVTAGGETVPMDKLHAEGFFCACLSGSPADYRLRLKLWDGREIEIDDPYRHAPQISDSDLHLHSEGTLYEAYRTLGAMVSDAGVRFAVWAPNALNVTVSGEFNDWDIRRHPMRRRNGGVWELFIPGLGAGIPYKYYVRSQIAGYEQFKADPYALACETPPKSASVTWKLDGYEWQDAEWMEARAKKDLLKSPVSVYEVHMGSWIQGLTYREHGREAGGIREADGLHAYRAAAHHGASVQRFVGLPGDRLLRADVAFRRPDDFKFFVDRCHQAGSA